jgi:FeS assembly SUF system regulator
VIRLSKLTDYGIVLLSHIASSDGSDSEHRLHNARELSSEAALPLPVVSKILKALARQGILESHRGAKGGYCLARAASEINVAEMIEALEGPVALTECSAPASACAHEVNCQVRDPWLVINHVVQDALTQISLSDLVSPHLGGRRPLDKLISLDSAIRGIKGEGASTQ